MGCCLANLTEPDLVSRWVSEMESSWAVQLDRSLDSDWVVQKEPHLDPDWAAEKALQTVLHLEHAMVTAMVPHSLLRTALDLVLKMALNWVFRKAQEMVGLMGPLKETEKVIPLVR